MSERITSVRFRNYKALKNFVLSVEHMNVIVGPNNSGKSTVLGAFQLLAAGLQRANARKSELVPSPTGTRSGYQILEGAVPISLENVHTDYDDAAATITFEISNGSVLTLYMPEERECYLFTEDDRCQTISPTMFRRWFPISIVVVPVLGPVDHEEPSVQQDAVRRGLNTHRASSHFRNYWWHNPEQFDEFRNLIRQTWPEMEIEFPERILGDKLTLAMFCREKRITRELYWAGFGFQVWCQILTHLVRAGDSTALVIDEPEIYLHPELQRRLLSILRDTGPDILIATHSSELVQEAETTEIVIVDKQKRRAHRVSNVKGTQAALDALGSVQNVTLTKLGRTQRILFIEGEDMRLLRRFAGQLGYADLAAEIGLTPVPIGGHPSPERVKAACFAFKQLLGEHLLFGCVFDRDYRSDEEVQWIRKELRGDLSFAHIHSRKEIENYLLNPKVLDRALATALDDRLLRTGKAQPTPKPMSETLDTLTVSLRADVASQIVSRQDDFRPRSKKDRSTTMKESMLSVEKQWDSVETRLLIVPGKQVMSSLNSLIQDEYKVTLTSRGIVEEFSVADIPPDLKRLIRYMDNLRTMKTK